MNRWKNQVAVVTGAAEGIGAAVTKALVQEGVKVVGLDIQEEKLRELATTLEVNKDFFFHLKCDVSKEEDIVAAFKWIKSNLGPVHILVNNAGIVKETSLLDGKTEDWKATMDINFMAYAIVAREAIKDMRENNVNGHVINMNSMTGHYIPSNVPVHVYGTAKFAVTALTQSLRQEINAIGKKIKVTSINPGGVKTDVCRDFKKTCPLTEMIKMHKVLLPEDVAAGIIYALGTPIHVQIHDLTLGVI